VPAASARIAVQGLILTRPGTPARPAYRRLAIMGYTYSRGWRRLTIVAVPLALRLLVTEKWRDQQYVPRKPGLIVAANHISEADPLAICHYLWRAGHYPVFLAKDALFGKGLVGKVVRGTGQIPVIRGGASAAESLRPAQEAIEAGQCLVVYPEGTCTRDPDLWPMTGQTGAARLALTTGAPVIPLASWGAHELLPYRKGEKGGLASSLKPGFHPFPRKKIQIIAGPEVDLSRYRDQPITTAVLRDATADIMLAIAGLVGQLRHQQPPAELYDHHKARAERGLPSDSA
jgi:1-acyl-sn-glycerol-3-phosphate acyltransferase